VLGIGVSAFNAPPKMVGMVFALLELALCGL
jgi:hypothetical protein